MNGKEKRRWIVIAAIVTFLLSMTLSAVFCSRDAFWRKNQASALLTSFKDTILLNLQKKFDYTDELAAVIMTDQGARYFEETAKRMMEYPACMYVELLDQTTLEKVYPQGCERSKEIGTDITKLDYAYTLAKLTKALVVGGPLVQAGRETLLIIRPLIATDIDGKKIFMGETAVALDSRYVLEALHLDQLQQSGYEYELWRVHPLNGSKQQIAVSSESVDFSDAIEVKFTLPTVWTLSIIPTTGSWYHKGLVKLLLFCSGAASAGAALLCFFYSERKNLKKTISSFSGTDQETGLLSRKGLLEKLEKWTAKQEEPFALIYITLNNYDHFSQLGASAQKEEFLAYIPLCIRQYVKSDHLLARVGECNFVLALKENCSKIELENVQKGLAIELLWKFTWAGEKIFITAVCGMSQFPADGMSPAELLNAAAQNYYIHASEENPAHELAQTCERIMQGEEGVLFGEYADMNINHLSKILTRYRRSLQSSKCAAEQERCMDTGE